TPACSSRCASAPVSQAITVTPGNSFSSNCEISLRATLEPSTTITRGLSLEMWRVIFVMAKACGGIPETVASEGRLRVAGAQEPECICQYMRIPSTAGTQDAERSRLFGGSLRQRRAAQCLVQRDESDAFALARLSGVQLCLGRGDPRIGDVQVIGLSELAQLGAQLRTALQCICSRLG